jgi:tetratricopeptide (TPR) repeat protein
MLHRFEEAAADFDRALSLRPDYAWALGYRALIHEFAGEDEACYRLFEETVRLCPQLYPDRHGERALLLCRLGRFAEASAAADTALTSDPDHALARYIRAVVTKRGGDDAAAEIAAARQIYSEPQTELDLELVGYRLAGLDALAGNFTAALDLLEQVLGGQQLIYEHACLDQAWDDLRVDPVASRNFASLLNAHKPRREV